MLSEKNYLIAANEQPPHNLTPNETQMICLLVDVRPDWEAAADAALRKVTYDNVMAVIDDGERNIKEKRLAMCQARTADAGLDGQFSALLERSSRLSHSLLCSANKETDLGCLRANLNRQAGRESAEAKAADAVLERQERLNRLLSQLFKCDILRRVGLAKQDSVYIDRGRETFEPLKTKVAAALEELGAADAEQFQAYPKARQILDALRQTLANTAADDFAEGFHAKIALPFSNLIGYDIEEFNEKDVIGNLRQVGQ